MHGETIDGLHARGFETKIGYKECGLIPSILAKAGGYYMGSHIYSSLFYQVIRCRWKPIHHCRKNKPQEWIRNQEIHWGRIDLRRRHTTRGWCCFIVHWVSLLRDIDLEPLITQPFVQPEWPTTHRWFDLWRWSSGENQTSLGGGRRRWSQRCLGRFRHWRVIPNDGRVLHSYSYLWAMTNSETSRQSRNVSLLF